MSSIKLRGALLGCGQVSRIQLDAWKQIENVEIVALYNRTISKANDLAVEYGISPNHVHANHIDLLDNEDIDFVDIATAPETHHELVLASAKRGKQILCQKPLAINLEEAKVMIASAAKMNVLLMVNENWRWRSRYREVKKLLGQDVIGVPTYVNVMLHSDICLPGINGEPPPLAVKQPYTKELEKLILFEWGIHIIDVLRFLFGEASDIFAQLMKSGNYFKGEDKALVLLDIGAVNALLDFSWSSPVKVRPLSESVFIEGQKGSIRFVNEDEISIVIQSWSGEEWIWRPPQPTMEFEYKNSYISAQRHFIECLITGKVPETNASDNLKTLATMFAAYESAAQKKLVMLSTE